MYNERRLLTLVVTLLLSAGLCTTIRGSVFPGAKGFGVDTPAGRGGHIIRVTNVDSEGPGSFREALETEGPRIIVFEVGGVIDLNKKAIAISEPFLTVAGQTAPSPGITIIRGGITITTHDVLIQHIRVRPGDAGQAKRSGWEPDGIATNAAYNVVIDHCSVSWSVDENLSASGPRHEGSENTSRNITFSNSIVAEALNNSSHSKGAHSKGSLIHDCCSNIAIIGNLYAHNVARNPYFKALSTGVVVNNVIYNPGRRAVQVDWPPSEWKGQIVQPQNARISVVGNVMIHGVDTQKDLALVCPKGDVYLDDNMATDRDGAFMRLTSGRVNILKDKPVWPDDFKPLSADRVVDHIVNHVGARPQDRDAVDKRIIREFQQRKGRIIDSQEEVGGYQKVKMTRRELTIPKQNMEAWLAKLALDLE
jgi:pectate lyase